MKIEGRVSVTDKSSLIQEASVFYDGLINTELDEKGREEKL